MSRVERLLDPMRNVTIRPIRSVLATGTLAIGSVVVLLGQTPPIVTVGVDAALPAVPRLSVDTQRLAPLVASGRLRRGTGETRGAEELSSPPRLVNQTTLLEHTELSALQGLTSPDSLRPALARRHTQTGPEIERVCH